MSSPRETALRTARGRAGTACPLAGPAATGWVALPAPLRCRERRVRVASLILVSRFVLERADVRTAGRLGHQFERPLGEGIDGARTLRGGEGRHDHHRDRRTAALAQRLAARRCPPSRASPGRGSSRPAVHARTRRVPRPRPWRRRRRRPRREPAGSRRSVASARCRRRRRRGAWGWSCSSVRGAAGPWGQAATDRSVAVTKIVLRVSRTIRRSSTRTMASIMVESAPGAASI